MAILKWSSEMPTAEQLRKRREEEYKRLCQITIEEGIGVVEQAIHEAANMLKNITTVRIPRNPHLTDTDNDNIMHDLMRDLREMGYTVEQDSMEHKLIIRW